MSASIAFASINVEHSKHVQKVEAFLAKYRPDVVCMQELLIHDIPRFEAALGAACTFEQARRWPDDEGHPIEGVGIFSRLPLVHKEAHYYRGSPDELPLFRRDDMEHTSNHMLLLCDVEKDGKIFRVGTTHFPWAANGGTNDMQRTDIQSLLGTLSSAGELVLAADFNAPRGGEIFSLLAKNYKDNIPPHYTTSIDGTLHRAGPLPFMVDGLFTTPAYSASGVSLVSGVSDHCAIVATITKTA